MSSISLDTLVLAKKYTDKVLTGLGALKGSPCTLKATKENDDGSITVTFSWTSSDGVEETQDVIIPAGPQGPQGEKGIQGEKGTDGVSPNVTITEIDGGHTITITDADGVKSITVKDGSPEDMANYYTKDETDTLFTSQKDELSEYVDEKVSESVGEGIVTATDGEIDNLFA